MTGLTDTGTSIRLRRRILNAGLWVTAGFVLDKIIAAGQLVAVARLLTPSDIGVMAASAAVMVTIMTLSEVGIEQALLTKRDPTAEDFAVAWTLSLGRAVVLTVGLWLGAGLLGEFLQNDVLALILRVHACALLVQAAQSPVMVMLWRGLDLRRRVTLDLTRRLAEAVVTIVLAMWLRSVWALLGGQLVGFVVGSVLSYQVAPFKPRWSLAGASVAYFVQYGRQLNLTRLCTFGLTSGGDLLIGRLLGLEALGVFQIAMALPLLLGTRVPLLMSQVSVPTYLMLEQDRPAIARAFLGQFALLACLLLPAGVICALWAPFLVEMIAGPQWGRAADPLRILSLYLVCSGLSSLMGSLHYGLHRPELQTKIWLLQFLCYGLIVIPLVTKAGLIGAAWALSMSYAVGLLMHLHYTKRLLESDGMSLLSMCRQEYPRLVTRWRGC